MVASIFAILVVGYLLGNMNGAVVISKLIEKDDVRRHGSGNAGMTNFFRSYGSTHVAFVILVDFGKAALAALLGKYLLAKYGFSLEGSILGGIAVVLGHNFPAVMRFKGGKGIMSSFGAIVVIHWPLALLLLAAFAVFYFTTYYVSLGSVMAAVTLIAAAPFFFPGNAYAIAGLVIMSALAIFMHRENIVRLWKHNERKTYFFKKEPKE